MIDRAGSIAAISDFQKSKSSVASDFRDCDRLRDCKHAGMDVTAWINRGLSLPGKTAGGLARALGVNASAVTELKGGRRSLKISEIVPAADYFGIDPPTFHRSRFVPHYGRVSGGESKAIFFDVVSDPIDWIQVPPQGDKAVGALEVSGNSMRGLAGDGWYVFFGERHEPPTRQQLDELCVVGLADGQRLVKFLHESKYEHRFDLHSSNDAPILAADVAWAALVTNIVPVSQAGNLERRSEMGGSGEFLKIENFC